MNFQDKNGQEISQMEVQFSVPSNQMDNFELRIVGQSEFDLPSRIKRRSYFAETVSSLHIACLSGALAGPEIFSHCRQERRYHVTGPPK